MDYPITMGSGCLGKVQVLREGLYYRFFCRCQRPGDQVYRLRVSCGDRRENLGILVPIGEGFGLHKRVPVTHLGEGPMEFELVPSHESVAGRFVPISPTEPFLYLQQLKDAHLARIENQLGAILPEQKGQQMNPAEP